MPKPTLEFYDNSFVPFNSADYMVIIADYPDLGPMVSDVTIPENSTDRVRVELFGKSRIWPGRNVWNDNELPMTMLLDRRSMTYQKLDAIHNSFSDDKTGNMVGKLFTIKVVAYDQTGIEAMVFTFKDCWLATIGSVELGSSNEAQLLTAQCVFGFGNIEMTFTGLSDSVVNTAVPNRFDGTAMVAGNTDRYGAYPSMGISKTLTGNDPMLVLSQLKQNLSSYVGFSVDDLVNMRNVINAVRGTLDGVTSKSTALSSLTNQSSIANAVSSLTRLASSV